MTQSKEDIVLHRAHEALEVGDVAQATYLARQVLKAAQSSRDALDEGRALACLADCDRQLSQLRRAHRNAQSAAHLLRQARDLAGEVTALTTLAHTAADLGRLDEAVEGARVAMSLAEGLPPSHLQPLAHDVLGTALLWCRDYARAEAAFERAADLVHADDPSASPLQPLLNLALLEALRCAGGRFDSGATPAVGRLNTRLADAAEIIDRHGDEGLLPGATAALRMQWHLLRGLAAAWAGDLQATSAELLWCDAWDARPGQTGWLGGLRRWLEAEAAWACGDAPLAQALAREIVTAAAAAEHESLACLGHQIVATLARARGDSRAEADELRALQRREQTLRVEALDSRERAREWQLQARASAEQVARLQSRSRMLEKLSLEDSLTRIPNRRALDRQLVARQAAAGNGGSPVCVALIDVNRFKYINDTFSHHVGDEVLRVVADLLSASVRSSDFVARLAGDEFVVLFGHATRPVAEQICSRMKAAVSDHGWQALAPGLEVGISIGLEQGRPGESMQALLQRSDAQMYADKRRGAARAIP